MSEKVLLGVADLTEAKRLRSLLSDRGVPVEFATDPDTCTTGKCGSKIEIYVREQDAPLVEAFLRDEKSRAFAGLEIDPTLLSEVFDPEKEFARCPACGTQFSAKASECPDCGLVFAIPSE